MGIYIIRAIATDALLFCSVTRHNAQPAPQPTPDNSPILPDEVIRNRGSLEIEFTNRQTCSSAKCIRVRWGLKVTQEGNYINCLHRRIDSYQKSTSLWLVRSDALSRREYGRREKVGCGCLLYYYWSMGSLWVEDVDADAWGVGRWRLHIEGAVLMGGFWCNSGGWREGRSRGIIERWVRGRTCA